MIISGTYNVTALSKWAQSQTRNEILEADTSGAPVIVNLPEIADIDSLNAQDVQIVVWDYQGNAATNNITVNATGGDTINNDTDTASVIKTDGAALVITIADGIWRVKNTITTDPNQPDLYVAEVTLAGPGAPVIDRVIIDNIGVTSLDRTGVGTYDLVFGSNIDAAKVNFVGTVTADGKLKATAYAAEKITLGGFDSAGAPLDLNDAVISIVVQLAK